MTGINISGGGRLNQLHQSYREERERQVRAHEELTGAYFADEQDYLARGGKPLITFKDWLKANKKSDAQQRAEAAPVSREVYVPDPAKWGGDEAPPW